MYVSLKPEQNVQEYNINFYVKVKRANAIFGKKRIGAKIKIKPLLMEI